MIIFRQTIEHENALFSELTQFLHVTPLIVVVVPPEKVSYSFDFFLLLLLLFQTLKLIFPRLFFVFHFLLTELKENYTKIIMKRHHERKVWT